MTTRRRRDHTWTRDGVVHVLAASLVLWLVLGATSVVVQRSLDAEQARARASVDDRLTATATALEQALRAKVVTAEALAAATSTVVADDASFRTFSEQLLSRQPGVRALQVADAGVVTRVHPLEGNEQALGLDVTRHPTQGHLARSALAGATTVGGPVELVQGGSGVIVRVPIRGDAGVVSAIAQVVVDTPSLLAQAGLTQHGEIVYALETGPPAAGGGGLALGTTEVLGDGVVATVDVPGRQWTLAAAPAAGWPAWGPSETSLLLAGTLLAALAAWATLNLLAAPARLRRRVVTATGAAQRANERLRGIMNSAPDGILGLDASGRVLDGNPAAEALLGTRIEQLLGRGVRSLLEQVPAPGVRLETRLLRDEEDGLPVEVVLQAHPDGSGSTLVLRDIRRALADRRQLEAHAAELERLNAELTTLDAMKRDFVSMASHEVRTPITAIRGFSLTLSRRWDELSDADRVRCFEVIHRQTDRLWRVIDDLLVASRIEAGAVDAEHMPTNVATVVARAIDDAGVPRSQVVVACPSDLDVIVVRDHLRRIITAYLTNAQKYGAAPFEVEARLDGDGVAVRVHDRGPGVDETFTDLLFDTFTQASTGITRTSTGTGLGLAVARGLAESVGGAVWYERSPSGGACFGVRLPALRQPGVRGAETLEPATSPVAAVPTGIDGSVGQRWVAPEAQAARSAAS